jgi:nucleoside-diphosphate-sugar epimerase
MSALPKGSLVLVTGASGWIASHVVDQALLAGYNVRGCVRAPERGQWLVDYVNEKYGPNRIELAVVPDMAVEGAFTEAVKGVAAFIHVASDLSFSADAHKVVEGMHKAIRSVIASIAAEPKMKHFIYTSSSSAVGFPQNNVPYFVAQDTWNAHSYQVAMDDSVTAETDPMKAAHVYAGSKYIAEKEALAFGKQQDRIVVNSVVPNMNWGPLLAPETQPADKLSSGALIPGLYLKGLEGLSFFKDFPPRKSEYSVALHS